MKGIIDRIEDGKIAVLVVKGKTLNLPVEFFDFEVREGMHLKINIEPDEKSEQKTRDEIKNLQEELLKRNEDQESKE